MATLVMDDINHFDVIAAQERIWGPRPARVESATDYYGVDRQQIGLNRRQRRANAAKARKAKK